MDSIDPAGSSSRKAVFGLCLSFAFAKRHGAFVKYEKNDPLPKGLLRAGVKPQVLQEITRFMETDVEFSLLPTDEFDKKLASEYQKAAEHSQLEIEDMGGLDLSTIAESISEADDLLEQQEHAPIIKLVNALLIKAIEEKASDIHIETFEQHMSVRFRIDGVLQEALRPKRAIALMLVSRIKIMARLDISEKRLPQDGHISLKIAGRRIDLRVSTIPANAGERVVLRILDKDAAKIELADIGISESQLETVKQLISRQHGIILVTGPTGSGKSTTLYGALKKLNDGRRNIMTVEDPIEYTLEGIGQTQVNTKIDMTFAQGLRAILRQDPDVVMVGEIRDPETAKIAIRASLTGHLVFSTLHTNSAIGAVARLKDMGVESYMISTSLVGLIAQRLVRMLCAHCKVESIATKEDCRFLNADPDDPPHVYRAVGCDKCRNTGYRGRTGLFEVIAIDEEMRRLIHNNVGEYELQEYVRTRGKGMLEQGCEKVHFGITSVEEVRWMTEENNGSIPL